MGQPFSLAILIYNMKLNARTCEVRKLTSTIANEFFNTYHKQRGIIAEVYYGLFYNNELVQAVSFGFPRIERQNNIIFSQYELYRECSKTGYYIRGGKSKLLKAFEREYKPLILLSYCNTSLGFDGHSYEACGFTLESTTKDYWYEDDLGNKYKRYQMQKNSNLRVQGKIEPIQKTLESIGKTYDPDLSEKVNAERAGLKLVMGLGQQNWKKYYSENIGFIYEIVNKLTGESYIGKHELVKNGIVNHHPYFGSGVKLKEAVKLYGKRGFSIKALYWTTDFEDLINKEVEYINKAKENGKAEYNVKLSKSDEWRLDPKFAKEIHDKSTTTNKNKLSKLTPEQRKEIYSHRMSEESKMKLSLSKTGLEMSEEVKSKISESMKSKWQDSKYRENVLKDRKYSGHTPTKEQRVKQSESLKEYYKTHEISEETRKKLSEAAKKANHKGYRHSEETKIKLSHCGKLKYERMKQFIPNGWYLVSEFAEINNLHKDTIRLKYYCELFYYGKQKIWATNGKLK